MMINMFKLISCCYLMYLTNLVAPGLAWQAALKKAKVKLDLFTDIDMLLMVGKGIREEYVTLFINMQKLIRERL